MTHSAANPLEVECANSIAQLGTVTLHKGSPEIDLIRANHFQRDRILHFEDEKGQTGLNVTAVVVLPLRNDHQFHVIGKKIGRESLVFISFDADRRLGSWCHISSLLVGMTIAAKLELGWCPFEVKSRFDNLILGLLRKAPKNTLTYDELREQCKINRGLPRILLNLERSGRVVCLRDEDMITTIALKQ